MTLVLHIRKGDWRCQLGRGGPHTCISVVFGGPRTDCANLFPASAAPVEDVRYTLINDAAPVLWQIRGRCSSVYGQHDWSRGNRQEMHGHLAGSLKAQLVASQECNVAKERATMQCHNKISRKKQAVAKQTAEK